MLVTAFASIAARDSLQAGATIEFCGHSASIIAVVCSGIVGLSLAYTLQLTTTFQWAVRQSAEVRGKNNGGTKND